MEGGTGGTTQSVRGNYKSFKGTNLTVVEGMHQLYHLPGIVYYCSRFDVTCGTREKKRCGLQRVIASWCVFVLGSQDRISQSIGATMYLP